MARDGVWRTVAPKDMPTGQISLTAASRADFDESRIELAASPRLLEKLT